MQEQAQAHYFGTILAIPDPVEEYQNIQDTESLKERDFSYCDKPKHSDRIPFILLSLIH